MVPVGDVERGGAQGGGDRRDLGRVGDAPEQQLLGAELAVDPPAEQGVSRRETGEDVVEAVAAPPHREDRAGLSPRGAQQREPVELWDPGASARADAGRSAPTPSPPPWRVARAGVARCRRGAGRDDRRRRNPAHHRGRGRRARATSAETTPPACTCRVCLRCHPDSARRSRCARCCAGRGRTARRASRR